MMRGSSLVIATGVALMVATAVLTTLGVDTPGPDGTVFLSGIFLGWAGLDLRKRWGV